MKKEELLSEHPNYKTFRDEWFFYIRSYLGGKFYREGDYLPKFPLESDANYQRRKENAYYYNYCAPIVDILVAYIYRKPPTRNYDKLSPKKARRRKPLTLFDAFWENVDYENTSFDQYMRNTLTLASTYGRVSVIVDKPQVPTLSLAEALEKDIRPYLVTVTPQNLLDWEYIRVQGRPVINRVKIAEKWDGEGKEPVRVRVWTRDSWELWDVSGNDTDASLIDGGENPLGEVPLVNLYNRRSGLEMIGLSDLQDIADINKSIYSLCSNATEIIENTAFPMLMMPYETGGSPKTTEVGPKNIIQFDPAEPNSRSAWLEAPHNSLTEIREWISKNTQEMARIAKMGGVSNVENSVQPWSSVAIEMLMDQLKAALVEKADNAEQAELDILRLWAKWEGEDFTGEIEYPKEFAVRDLTVSLQNAINAKNAGVVSVLFEKKRQKKVVEASLPELDEADRENIIKEIDENVKEINSGEQGQVYEYHLKAGIITINELRKRLGLPPLPSGGDELVVLEDAQTTEGASQNNRGTSRENKDNGVDYPPKSLHEAMTYVLGLPLDATAGEIAAALKEAAAKHAGSTEGDHPDSHMILVEAINSPSEKESDALKTLLKVAEKMAKGDMKHG